MNTVSTPCSGDPDDAELLARLAAEPEVAWRQLIERHAGFVLSELERAGLDYDAAMDAFVTTCERLGESNFRRLRSVELAPGGSLEPWLRTVVSRVATDLRWSRWGRRRVFAAVRRLGSLEEEVFRLAFWAGLSPTEMLPELSAAGHQVDPVVVFTAWERVLEAVGASGSRHLAILAARRPPVPLADLAGPASSAPQPDPELETVGRDLGNKLRAALALLPSRLQLLLRLRYEDGLGLAEVGDLLGVSRRSVGRELERALGELRERLDVRPQGDTAP